MERPATVVDPELRAAVNLEKVVFGFFVVLAATLNFGFFIGDLGDPELHSVYELFAAVVVNLIATVLKFGDRTQIGAVHLATSLVASLQLITAAVVWTYSAYVLTDGVLTAEQTAAGVALRWGAVRQRGVRGAAGGRDRLLPATLKEVVMARPPLRSSVRTWRPPASSWCCDGCDCRSSPSSSSSRSACWGCR